MSGSLALTFVMTLAKSVVFGAASSNRLLNCSVLFDSASRNRALPSALRSAPRSQPVKPDRLRVGIGVLHVVEQPGQDVEPGQGAGSPEEVLALPVAAVGAAAVQGEALVLLRQRQHGQDVVAVGGELGRDARRAELGHRLHAGLRIARLVVLVDDLDLGAASGLDVLDGEVDAAAHRLAVERAVAGQGQHGTHLPGLPAAELVAGLQAEGVEECGTDVTTRCRARATPTPRCRGAASGRPGGGRRRLLVVAPTCREHRRRGEGGGTDEPQSAQHLPPAEPVIARRVILVDHCSPFGDTDLNGTRSISRLRLVRHSR